MRARPASPRTGGITEKSPLGHSAYPPVDKRLSLTHEIGYSGCEIEFRGQPPSAVVPGQTESDARVELVQQLG